MVQILLWNFESLNLNFWFLWNFESSNVSGLLASRLMYLFHAFHSIVSHFSAKIFWLLHIITPPICCSWLFCFVYTFFLFGGGDWFANALNRSSQLLFCVKFGVFKYQFLLTGVLIPLLAVVVAKTFWWLSVVIQVTYCCWLFCFGVLQC